jgi:predicted site-specific integrase-resolvase
MGKIYRIHEFAQRIGRSPSTVRRWEYEGRIVAKRLSSGHRYFDESDVRAVLIGTPEKRLTVVYCRVSNAKQSNELQAQVAALEQYCLAGAIIVDEWIQEVGGGLNFNRKHFLSVIERIQRGEIGRLLIAHKDRLVRFGFELVSHFAQTNGCEILVLNQESLSPEQEMVDDLLTIIHTFGSRLEGIRKYKKQIRVDFPGSKESIERLQ